MGTCDGVRRTGLVTLAGLMALLVACGAADKKQSAAPPGGSGAAMAAATVSAGQSAENKSSGSAAARPATATDGQAAPPSGSPAAEQLPGIDRKVISNVSMELTVKDVQQEYERVAAIAESNLGFVSNSSLHMDGKSRVGSVTIRVPGERLQPVLVQLRGLSLSVDSETSDAKDVTEEYTDLQSRLRNLQASEAQYLVFLGQTKNISDLLQTQERINSTRAEIERVQGRINLLSRLSDLATIRVGLHPEAAPAAQPPKPGPLAPVSDAWRASFDVMAAVGVGTLTAPAFSWWLLPLVAVAVWWGRRERRRRAAGGTAAPGAPGTP